MLAERAAALSPHEPRFHLTRARLERRACIELLRDTVSCDAATTAYAAAAERAPKDPRILRETASFSALMGREEQAEVLLEQAVQLEPDYVAAWRDRTVLPGGGSLQDELEAAIRRAAGRQPDSAYAHEILAAGPGGWGR